MGTKSSLRFEAVGAEQLFGRKLLVILGIGVALASIIGLFIFGQYLWHGAEARENAHEGAILVERKEYDRAIPLLRAAWQQAPQDVEVLRNLAKAFDAIGAGSTVSLWQQILDSRQATVDDRISMAAAMVKASNLEAARRVLAAIPDPERHQMRCVEIEAKLLYNEGNEKAANELLRTVWAASPDDPGCRMKLAQMDLGAAFEPFQEEARKTLWEIARTHESLAPAALVSLINSMELTPEIVAKVREIMAGYSKISSVDRLAVFGSCVNKVPSLATEFEADESKRFAGKKPDECPEFYEWLAKLGDAPRILKDLAIEEPQGKLRARPEVFRFHSLYLAYAEALMLKGRWQELSAFLEKPKNPVSSIELEVLHALCANGLGKSQNTIDAHLVAALASARGAHNMWGIGRIARFSERLGRNSIALDAYSALATDPSQRLEALKHLFELQQQRRDADGMLQTAESIHAMNKSLTVYSDDVVYLKLVTGKAFESAWNELAGDSSKREATATTPMRRLAQALAFHLCGKDDEVARQIDGLEPHALPTGARAVLAGLLAEAGRPADAFSIAEKIAPDWILPEENWYRKKAFQ